MVSPVEIDLSELEEIDDLNALREDIGENSFDVTTERREGSRSVEVREAPRAEESQSQQLPRVVNDPSPIDQQRVSPNVVEPVIFDTANAEEELLSLAPHLETQISKERWEEIISEAQVSQYTVQEGDWLWRISQRFFGSGFYYPKIWSLNPKIRNPHEIEPGMILIFDTGTIDELPGVRLGEFDEREAAEEVITGVLGVDLALFGDEVIPDWLIERERLRQEGAYFQYASPVTYEDLQALSERYLEREYERYEPPQPNIIIQEPGEQYDELGFDRDSIVEFSYRDGFYLTTFVTSNVVQDLGEIQAIQSERIFIQRFDTIYLNLDSELQLKPGDRFSVYSPQGKVSHPVSDREGYRYTIVAQVELIRPIEGLWEAHVKDIAGTVQRGDRLTVYTPSLSRIAQSFSRRNIEAAVIGSYGMSNQGVSLGDVIYLDRGRIDGVEMGNVFELYSFVDRGTGRRISTQPTYKIGELVVLNVTDNFSTALVLNNSTEVSLGTLAITKTAEAVAREQERRSRRGLRDLQHLERESLETLDVELDLSNLAKDLLKKADEIDLRDDEFDELERRERESSIIDDHERDLRELQRLEQEIAEAEAALGEARVDEDLYLEQQDLDAIEMDVVSPSRDAFESLDEIEGEIGRRYMDEDLNARENPFGLTEFDIEEIDLLLNSGQE